MTCLGFIKMPFFTIPNILYFIQGHAFMDLKEDFNISTAAWVQKGKLRDCLVWLFTVQGECLVRSGEKVKRGLLL